MKEHVQIKNSFNIWKPSLMRGLIIYEYCSRNGGWLDDLTIVNGKALTVEWWLHNIGYWVTLPFVRFPAIRKLNVRFQHVDLMVEMKKERY